VEKGKMLGGRGTSFSVVVLKESVGGKSNGGGAYEKECGKTK
jgi:hypothetical protein